MNYYIQKRIETAINIQAIETYCDILSPIRASFQNIPSILKIKKK